MRCFLRTGRTTVTICDTNHALLDHLTQLYPVTAVADWQAAIHDGDMTAAVICTPAQLHIPIAKHLLETGIHTLIEKPLSCSLQNVDALIQSRDRSGRQAAVAYVYHTFPFLRQSSEFLRRGTLGPVKQVTMTSGQHFPSGRTSDAVHYAETYYRDRNTGGGAIQDALTHSANWVESIVGPTDSVLCDCAHQVLERVTVEDTVHVSSRHGDVLVNYTLNQFQAPNETTIQFNTARGSVKIEIHRQRWGTFRFGDSDWNWQHAPTEGRDTHFTTQAHAFLDQIEGKSPALCSIEEAAQTLRFNLAALTAASTGNRVHLADLHA